MKNKFNNKKILGVSILATLVLGSSIFYLQKKAVNYTPKTKVYIAKNTINRGKEISNDSFEIKERPTELVTKDILTEKEDFNILSKIAKDTIYSGEMINKNRLVDKNDIEASVFKLKKGEVEFSINVQLLDNYAGTYRAGDIVMLAFTPKATKEEPEPKTEILVRNVRALGAINSSGKFLTPEDKNELATGIAFAGTENDFKLIAEKQNSGGKFKIAKINTSNSEN